MSSPANHPLPARPTGSAAAAATAAAQASKPSSTPKPPKPPNASYASFTASHPLYNDSTKQAAARMKRQQHQVGFEEAVAPGPSSAVASSSSGTKKRPAAAQQRQKQFVARTHDDLPTARGVVDVRRQPKKKQRTIKQDDGGAGGGSNRIITPASGSSAGPSATPRPTSGTSSEQTHNTTTTTGAADFVPFNDDRNEIASSDHRLHSGITRESGAVRMDPAPVSAQGDGKGKGKGRAQEAQRLGGGAVTVIEPWARDREATKILLANPARVEWPTLSTSHSQFILHALLQAFPGLATYHLERDRLNRLENKKMKKRRRSGSGKSGVAAGGKAVESEKDPDASSIGAQKDGTAKTIDPDIISTLENASGSASEHAPAAPAAPVNPPPDLLAHLVFGINEVSKRMEKQISWLAEEAEVLCGGPVVPMPTATAMATATTRTAAVAAINGPQTKRHQGSTKESNLIPTAPVAPAEGDDSDTEMNSASGPEADANTPDHTTPRKESSPLRIIYVCYRDVNPPALVEAIPQYARSWNAVVRACRVRLAQVLHSSESSVVSKNERQDSEDRERLERALRACVEVLVVPLPPGAEYELAMATGLRRVAVVGMTSAFPNLSNLLDTLRAAALPVMLPPFPLFPVMSAAPIGDPKRKGLAKSTCQSADAAKSIVVGDSNPVTTSTKSIPISATRAATTRTTTTTTVPSMGDAPIFAPTSIKYLSTSAPLDPKARKAHRLACVRKKRIERKEAKKAAWESAKIKMKDQARRYVNASAKYDRKRKKEKVLFTEGMRQNVP